MPIESFEIEQLTEKCFGNMELVHKLVDRFLVSLPNAVSEIKKAFVELDFEEIKSLSHHLKGEAGTMCAAEISSLASRIFEAAEAENIQQLSDHICKITEQTAAFEQVVHEDLTAELHFVR